MKRIPRSALKIVVLHKDPGRYDYAKSQTGARISYARSLHARPRFLHSRSGHKFENNHQDGEENIEHDSIQHELNAEETVPNEIELEEKEQKEPNREYYFVGRSMYETDRVPADWIEIANDPDMV
jgi:hypothetical protein